MWSADPQAELTARLRERAAAMPPNLRTWFRATPIALVGIGISAYLSDTLIWQIVGIAGGLKLAIDGALVAADFRGSGAAFHGLLSRTPLIGDGTTDATRASWLCARLFGLGGLGTGLAIAWIALGRILSG